MRVAPPYLLPFLYFIIKGVDKLFGFEQRLTMIVANAIVDNPNELGLKWLGMGKDVSAILTQSNPRG